MTGLITVLCLILIALVVVQIGRVTELASRIRGEEEAQQEANNWNARFSLVFMVIFLVGCIASAIYYKDSMLGYGPHLSASEHGGELDRLFNVTLFFTGIVFVITQIALFWFSYKYKGVPGRKALFLSHDNKIEIIWTVIPAVVMTFLVIGGLDAWNEVMADVGPGEEHIEIEATGMQFAWIMRYPGNDGALGTKDYRLITANNQLGMDFNDTKGLDDIVSSAAGEIIKLPIGKKVRVRITARDVLHNFDLPHFRVKMDAVPGLPTHFVFTPAITSQEYRERLGSLDSKGEPVYPEWHLPADPTDPESKTRWEEFQFELACAELCGKGHYSMRRIVEIVSEEEFAAWAAEQKSFYFQTIRGTAEDPNLGTVMEIEKTQRKEAFKTNFERAVVSTEDTDKVLKFDYLTYETGSAKLDTESSYELDELIRLMKGEYKNVSIEVSGHTDNTGDADANMELSKSRAASVYNRIIQKGVELERVTSTGYGQDRPIDKNDTDEGRANNRRTEIRILSQ